MQRPRTLFLAATMLAVPAALVMMQAAKASGSQNTSAAVTAPPAPAEHPGATSMESGKTGSTPAYGSSAAMSHETATSNPTQPGTTVTAPPAPAEHPGATTMERSTTGSTAYGGSKPVMPHDTAAANPTKPGATGRTVLPGNHSTVAGDRKATRSTQVGVAATNGSGSSN